MERPYIICHMLISIDGKVTGDFLARKETEAATTLYYEKNRAFKADAYACGRITMEGSFTGGWYPDLSEYDGVSVPEGDFIADNKAGLYAVAFDRQGKLGWKTAKIEDEDPGYGGAHIIEVICGNAPVEYLAYLRSIGVSYIFAGETEMDIHLALEKLYSIFGIRNLLLEGGSILNGAFAGAGVVDELSLVMVPMTADSDDKPLFMDCMVQDYSLSVIEHDDDGVIYLSYKKKT